MYWMRCNSHKVFRRESVHSWRKILFLFFKLSLNHYGVYKNNGVEGLQNDVMHLTTGVTAKTILPLATKRSCDGDGHQGKQNIWCGTSHVQECNNKATVASTFASISDRIFNLFGPKNPTNSSNQKRTMWCTWQRM